LSDNIASEQKSYNPGENGPTTFEEQVIEAEIEASQES